MENRFSDFQCWNSYLTTNLYLANGPSVTRISLYGNNYDD